MRRVKMKGVGGIRNRGEERGERMMRKGRGGESKGVGSRGGGPGGEKRGVGWGLLSGEEGG